MIYLDSRALTLRAQNTWLKEQPQQCVRCNRKDFLSVEHIIPMSILWSLGINADTFFDPDNLEVLCTPCNHYKANRIDLAHPRSKELMKKYIELMPTIPMGVDKCS